MNFYFFWCYIFYLYYCSLAILHVSNYFYIFHVIQNRFVPNANFPDSIYLFLYQQFLLVSPIICFCCFKTNKNHLLNFSNISDVLNYYFVTTVLWRLGTHGLLRSLSSVLIWPQYIFINSTLWK